MNHKNHTGESSIFRQGSDSSEATNVARPRRGPPNRMNDLNYRDWMKFQKSFFQYESDDVLIDQCLQFFTKAVWDDGNPSKSLILGCEAVQQQHRSDSRIVVTDTNCESLETVIDRINECRQSEGYFDFALIDLRKLVASDEGLNRFMCFHNEFSSAIRNLLHEGRYACLLVDWFGKARQSFPYSWAVALAVRDRLRLRDEKVGLVSDSGHVMYCLFVQADDDGRDACYINSKSLCLASTQKRAAIPAWIIPRSPPRSKVELRHPGKFPEILIERFISLFSSELESVFDPMVGTGSTLIAALRTNRYGVGIDLSEEYVQLSQDRIQDESAPLLFADVQTDAEVFVGDAKTLHKVEGIKGRVFNYAVTSPPYWSMLTRSGSENQRQRKRRELPLTYSRDDNDIGNLKDYDAFLDTLETVYDSVAIRLVNKGVLTVIVKSVKKDHTLHTLPWDLVLRLCRPNGRFKFVGTTLWCQDNVGLKPFAVGTHWVSNTLHTYCLHFEVRK